MQDSHHLQRRAVGRLAALLMLTALLLPAPRAHAQGGGLVSWRDDVLSDDGTTLLSNVVSGTPTMGGFKAVAAGKFHSTAIRADGDRRAGRRGHAARLFLRRWWHTREARDLAQALVSLFGKANWWLPKGLARVLFVAPSEAVPEQPAAEPV